MAENVVANLGFSFPPVGGAAEAISEMYGKQQLVELGANEQAVNLLATAFDVSVREGDEETGPYILLHVYGSIPKGFLKGKLSIHGPREKVKEIVESLAAWAAEHPEDLDLASLAKLASYSVGGDTCKARVEYPDGTQELWFLAAENCEKLAEELARKGEVPWFLAGKKPTEKEKEAVPA